MNARYVDSPEDAIAFAARAHAYDLRGIPVVLRVTAGDEGPLRSPGEIRAAYRRLAALAETFLDRIRVEEYSAA